jgi:hypothetical protein
MSPQYAIANRIETYPSDKSNSAHQLIKGSLLPTQAALERRSILPGSLLLSSNPGDLDLFSMAVVMAVNH